MERRGGLAAARQQNQPTCRKKQKKQEKLLQSPPMIPGRTLTSSVVRLTPTNSWYCSRVRLVPNPYFPIASRAAGVSTFPGMPKSVNILSYAFAFVPAVVGLDSQLYGCIDTHKHAHEHGHGHIHVARGKHGLDEGTWLVTRLNRSHLPCVPMYHAVQCRTRQYTTEIRARYVRRN